MANDTSITLIIAITSDPASVGPAEALLGLGGWAEHSPVEGNPAWINGSTRLWILNGDRHKLILEDHLDQRWLSKTGDKISQVLFLSRHVAASKKPALTLHPIGVPHLTDGQVMPSGGSPGWAAPPCPLLGPWLRSLDQIAKKRGLLPEFEVTLEATHHGPTIHSPAMFCEVGSSEEYWGRADAWAAMADLIYEGLGLGTGPGTPPWAGVPPGTPVLVGIGGGHYVPRHCDVIRKGNVWVGHVISGYTLLMEEAGSVREGATWHHVIRTAVDTTKEAFPGGRVMVHLDSKSFKSWQRNAIIAYCNEEGIEIGTPLDFLN